MKNLVQKIDYIKKQFKYHMRHILLIPSLSLIVLISCGQNTKNENSKILSLNLSKSEISLLDSLQFDHDIIKTLRIYTDSTITKLSNSFNFYNDSLRMVEAMINKHLGFSFKSDKEKARRIVIKLKDEFKEKGYLIYISKQNFGYEPDEVSILKGFDQFEILKVEETDGINYGLENKDVIGKLKKWNAKYPFQIIGAGEDWVEAIFIRKPVDLKAFSKELYEFCPDIVDQGVGSVKKLERKINKSNILYLWWD